MASVVESEPELSSNPKLGHGRLCLKMLLVSTVGIVTALLIIELGFRAILWASPHKRWSDRPKYYYAPPAATTLQDFPHSAIKPPSTFRIAVAGDSFSFGPNMQFDDTFSKRLERILSMNDGPLKAEVINYGVAGYSTADEVNVATRAAKEGSDLILLQITLNDPELQQFRPKGGNGSRFGPLKITEQDTPLLYYWKSLGFVAQRLHAEKTRAAYRQYFFDLFENPDSWGTFKKSVEEIARLRDAYPTRVAAVVFPLISFGFDDSYPFSPIHEKIAALAQSLNLPLLDLFEAYRDIPHERLEVVPGQDPHPNEIAHRVAAEYIYVWLVEQKLLPETLRVKQAYVNRSNATISSRFSCAKRPRACFGMPRSAGVRNGT